MLVVRCSYMTEKKEPVIIFTTFNGKVFGVKTLSYNIVGDSFIASARMAGDKEKSNVFLKDVTELLKKYCEDNYKEYGLV